jgi:AraC-like DNA-binding protein
MEAGIPRALPETCYVPRLWLWPGQAVYVGPSLGLDPHSGSVSCLAVAINGTCEVRVDATSGPPARSVLIPPRLRHQIVPAAELMVFCYLDPGSARHRACRRAMTTTADALEYRHRHETALAVLAEDLSDAKRARAWLDLASGDSRASGGTGVTTGQQAGPADEDACPRPDSRIRRAVAALHALDPSDDAPAARLAALVGLSPSRFLHLFRDHTGTSYRRYRLWLRMLCAAELLRNGHDLTTAAAGAGFASPSHFSDTFHAMFGLRPRQFLGTTEINLAGPPQP